MRILHVNTYDRGGAGAAAIRLHVAMLNKGLDSTLVTMSKTRSDVPCHIEFPKKDSLPIVPFWKRWYLKATSLEYKRLLAWNVEKRNQEHLRSILPTSIDYFSFIHTPHRLEKWDLFDQFDIINLHWVSDFIHWPTFFEGTKGKKIVWTLHDLFPFTGGYHYGDGFEGYKGTDIDDPFTDATSFRGFCHKQLTEKIELFERYKPDIHVVPLSNWIKDCSVHSSLFKSFPHTKLGNTLNENVFKPLPSEFCRKALNLSTSKKICLFLSDNLENKRKCFALLQDSIEKMQSDEIQFVCVGRKVTNNATKNITWLGSIEDERLMALAYNAADLVIVPSKEDNLPNTVMEAMFCGKPVVGFNVGGLPDMIVSGVNGVLLDLENANDLGVTIYKALMERKFDSGQIRMRAVEYYGNDVIVQQYCHLYTDFLVSKS